MTEEGVSKPRRFSLFAKPLGQTLTQVVKPIYKKHGFAEHRILTEWNLIVGEELAAWSLPQKLVLRSGKKEGGTLHILVAAGRALEIQHMQPVILDKIATYFGYPAAQRLTLNQTHMSIFRKEKKATLKPKPAPDKALTDLMAGCEDEDLRRVLTSLGTALAAVEK